MKKALVLCALVGVGVYATTALSASGPTPVEKSLQRDVATLKKQVKTLQTQVKNLNNNTGEAVAELAILGVCTTELTSDALQGTWQVIDKLTAAAQPGNPAGIPTFGVQTPIAANVNGRDVCSLVNVSRSQVLPPTIAPYQALLSHYVGASSADRAHLLRLK
jgi:hypothetical protein